MTGRVLWLNGRASDYESGGCRFDPCQDHIFDVRVCDMTRSAAGPELGGGRRGGKSGMAVFCGALYRSPDPMWRLCSGGSVPAGTETEVGDGCGIIDGLRAFCS